MLFEDRKMIWKERGSATIENLFWLPLLLLIFAAIVQFGLIFNARNAVQAASFEGARQAIVSNSPVRAAQNAVYNFANGVLPGWRKGGRVRVFVSAPAGFSPGKPVTVRVEYDVPIFFSAFFKGLETSRGIVTLKGSSTMKIEEKP